MHKPRPGSRRRRPSPARRRAAAVPPLLPDEAADEEGEDKFVGPWGEARASGDAVEPAESVGEEEDVDKEERRDLGAAFGDLGRLHVCPAGDELLLLDQCSPAPAPTPTWMTLGRSKGGMAAIRGGKISSHLPIYPFELSIINKIKNIIYYLRN